MPSEKLSSEEQVNSNLLFQRELQNILSIIIKERSLEEIINEILQRCVNVVNADFGIVFIPDNGLNTMYHYDPDNLLKDIQGLEKGIISHYPFLTRWFKKNRNSFTALRKEGDIGYNFALLLNSESVVFSQCTFEDNFLAIIITGKKNNIFNPIEIRNIEQFASILSFSISNVRMRELNAALESRLLQAQKLETIGKLSSGMAHDFNNLLSSIFGSLNLLKKKVPDDDHIKRLLDNIENCSIRAKDLTKGLLSYGKPTPTRKELVEPNTLLKEMSKVITQTFPGTITFKSDIEDKLSPVTGNSTEIYQVLLNLCVNAKEAIPKDGTVILSAHNLSVTDENAFSYPLLSKGEYVQFSVTDNGSGIDEENIQKIFDPYFSTKSKDTGSGLGLYVTYGIIKAHGGIIDVTSEIGRGTTFDVYLPAVVNLTDKSSSNNNDKIILLVDDELMLRDLLAELLEANSYAVIKEASGEDAIKVLSEEIKVDLVIIDYNMPGMNGIECIRKIRELNFKMPIILSTGSYNLENKDNMDNLGISSILSKPYEFDTMLDTIKLLF